MRHQCALFGMVIVLLVIAGCEDGLPDIPMDGDAVKWNCDGTYYRTEKDEYGGDMVIGSYDLSDLWVCGNADLGPEWQDEFIERCEYLCEKSFEDTNGYCEVPLCQESCRMS